MTPSDFISGLTGRGLPATSTVVTAATDLSWVAVPSVITSDLSAFNCRWFRKNHRLTASEQRVSRSRADVWSPAFMATKRCKSSAKWWWNRSNESISSLTGATYAVKRSGPSTEPCGTPESHGVMLEECWQVRRDDELLSVWQIQTEPWQCRIANSELHLEPFYQNVVTNIIERRRYVPSDECSSTSVVRCRVHAV